MKAVIENPFVYDTTGAGQNFIDFVDSVNFHYKNGTVSSTVYRVVLPTWDGSPDTRISLIHAAVIAHATSMGLSISSTDIIWPDGPSIVTPTHPVYPNVGTLQVDQFPYESTAVVSGTTAVFYLTSNHLSTGSAVFGTSVDVNSVEILNNNNGSLYSLSAVSIAGDRKSVTATVTKTSPLLGLLGLGAAPAGDTVKIRVRGK